MSYFKNEYATKPCLAELTRNYYADISKHEAKNNPGENYLGARASLETEAGSNHLSDLKPGWAWQAALKHAKGDPNLAMNMIGFCGHDDIHYASYAGDSESSKKIIQLNQEIEAKEKQVDFLMDEVKKAPSSVKKKYGIQIEKLHQTLAALYKKRAQTSSGTPRLKCPGRSSVFFTPKSLGPNADIDNQLKKRIAETQAPEKGASAIPAKYYHVYGGAFMACQLVQQGVSPSLAETVQGNAALLYRSLRSCKHIKKKLKLRDQWVDEHLQHVIDKKGDFPKELSKRSGYYQKPKISFDNYVAQEIRAQCFKNQKFQMYDQCEKFIMYAGVKPKFRNGRKIEERQIDEFVEKVLARVNAAELYKKWFLKIGLSDFSDHNVPCSNIRLQGPAQIKPGSDLPTRYRTNKCGPEFSKKGCNSARKVLDTWDADYEWTIAQHRAGAAFAGENCKPVEQTVDLEASACRALGKSQATPQQDRSKEASQ